MRRILLTIILSAVWFLTTAQTTSTLPSGYTPFATQLYYKIAGGDTTIISGATGKGFHVIQTTQALRDSLNLYYTKTAADLRYVPLTRTITINGTTQNLSANRTWTLGISDFSGLQDSLTKKANKTFDNVASGTIANAKLANSTISGISLGSSLNNFSAGYGLTWSAYNGSAAITAKVDTTSIQTVANFFPKGDTRWSPISGSSNYIRNGLSSQNAHFNISETGRIGKHFYVDGTTSGAVGIGGELYNHVMVAVGHNSVSPLNELHQVAFYAALKGNNYATGAGSFVAGFETALSTAAGSNIVDDAVGFSVGATGVGAGSSIKVTRGLATHEEIIGTQGNAAISDFANTVTGDWYIHYAGSRPSKLGGLYFGSNEQHRIVNDDYFRISGGNSPSNGARLTLYGGTNATNPDDAILTSNSLLLTGSLGLTGTRVSKGWFTDLEVSNTIIGNISGSATTLNTTRTIWGQNFNGSANVSGALSNATTGTFSSYLDANNYKMAAWDAMNYAGTILQLGGVTASQWNNVQLYTSGSSRVTIDASGNTTINTLAGTGTRMVVANNLGQLSTTAIPSGGGGGAVATVGVTSANGLSGTSDGNATNPSLTLSTTVTGMVKGNGTALSAATAGTDYISPTGTETMSNKTISGDLHITGDLKWGNNTGFGLISTGGVRFLSYTSGGGLNLGTGAVGVTLGSALSATSGVFSSTLSASNLSGTNTGDQTITLTGAVTGTGTGSFATTLASGIDATKLADGSVTSTELQYINTLSSNAQTQLDTKITASSTNTLTNKSGNISQWTNDSGYITASSSNALTNKTGAISQWTNDTGYLTSAVTSITSGSGMGFSTITGTGTITMGTPSSVTLASTNSTSTTSHTHAFAPGGTSSQYVRGDGTLATTPTGSVTSIASGNGMNFSTITGTGTITMGTPSSITSSSTNSVSTTSHTHELTSIPSAATATTQTAGDNSTKVATTAYVENQIGAKVYKGTYTSASTGTTFTVSIGATLANNTYSVALTPGIYHTYDYKIQNKTTTTFDIVFEFSLSSVNMDWILAR